MILAVFFTCAYGQKLSDAPFEICKNDRLVGKWLSAQSSLTDNQGKIDIGYYGINLEINIDDEQIIGSVIVNGSVGINQPDSIDLDLTSELIVDLDGVDIGHSFKISSIKLPENVIPTITGRDFVIATVAAPTVIKEPEKPAEAAEGEEGAEGSTDAQEAAAAPKDGADEKGGAEAEKKDAGKKDEGKKPQSEKK